MNCASFKKVIMVCLVLVGSHMLEAQSITTRFFNDRYLQKEVAANKARFLQTISHEGDGRVTTEVKDLRRNELLSRETLKGEEPFGVWFYHEGNRDVVLDYEFELVYAEKKFEENEITKELSDFFADNDSLGFKAPVIASGENNIARFVFHNMHYPIRAREEGIQGKVQVGFTITNEARVEDFVIYKGTNILLDKEAVRVIRKLGVLSPPMLKGVPTTFKLMLPLSFKVQ